MTSCRFIQKMKRRKKNVLKDRDDINERKKKGKPELLSVFFFVSILSL